MVNFSTLRAMTDYIRIKNTLPNSPKVMLLARELECSQNEALGVMVRWLAWLDMYTEDGNTKLSPTEVDAHIFGNVDNGYFYALETIGWATTDADNKVFAIDFDKYCTPTAKKRISGMERQRKHRAKKGGKA